MGFWSWLVREGEYGEGWPEPDLLPRDTIYGSEALSCRHEMLDIRIEKGILIDEYLKDAYNFDNPEAQSRAEAVMVKIKAKDDEYAGLEGKYFG